MVAHGGLAHLLAVKESDPQVRRSSSLLRRKARVSGRLSAKSIFDLDILKDYGAANLGGHKNPKHQGSKYLTLWPILKKRCQMRTVQREWRLGKDEITLEPSYMHYRRLPHDSFQPYPSILHAMHAML